MKVYVVEKGQYSERHVVAVVETKEAAEKICGAISGYYDYDRARYEEFDTEQFSTGLVRFYGYFEDGHDLEYDEYNYWIDFKESTLNDMSPCIIYAESISQARKILQDMVAQEEAERRGLT